MGVGACSDAGSDPDLRYQRRATGVRLYRFLIRFLSLGSPGILHG